MKEHIVSQIRGLSAGTIGSLTNLRRYDEIDALRQSLIGRTEKWLAQGVLAPNQSWQDAWNLFAHCHAVCFEMFTTFQGGAT